MTPPLLLLLLGGGQDGEAGCRDGGDLGGAKRILLRLNLKEEEVLGHFNFCNSCSLLCDRRESRRLRRC